MGSGVSVTRMRMWFGISDTRYKCGQLHYCSSSSYTTVASAGNIKKQYIIIAW